MSQSILQSPQKHISLFIFFIGHLKAYHDLFTDITLIKQRKLTQVQT